MNRLDRDGTFKARPISWNVKTSPSSKSVGINVEFQIVAQLVEKRTAGHGDVVQEWESWEEYDPTSCYGTFWVIGKAGAQNVTAIDQLVVSGLWDGDLKSVLNPVPDVVVQIQVKAEEYQGTTYYKAAWLHPEDHVPGPGGASRDEVSQLSAQFGSLLRAAAAGAKRKVGGGKAPPPAAPAPKPAAPAPSSSRPATSTLPDPVGGAPLTWIRKEAIDRLGAATDDEIKAALNDAGMADAVKTRTQVAGLDDESLKRFDDALFNLNVPF